MSEPRRLLDEGGDGLGLDLLRSARDDGPSAGARNKTLVALGVGVGVGATVTTGTAASTALIKWIGIGVAGGLLTLGAAELAGTRGPQEKPAVAVTGQAAEVARRKAVVVASAEKRDREAAEPERPAAAPEPAKVAPEPSAKPSAGPARSSLSDEVELIDGARRALGSGDARGCLAQLDRYQREFPRGVLGPEATILRIDALMRAGDRASAVRLGKAYLKANPRSVHASRLRTLLGDDAPPADP